MKFLNLKWLFLLSGVCLAEISVGIEHSGEFRGWSFGTTFESITRDESAAFDRTTPTAAMFRDSIFGLPTKVIYHFSPESDGLVGGAYDFNCTGFEIEEVLDHYMKVKSVLDERYGKSLKSGEVWWNDKSEYRNDPVNAFRFADVSFRNEWFGPGVIVLLTLSNEINTQGRFVYTINYRPGRYYNCEEDTEKL